MVLQLLSDLGLPDNDPGYFTISVANQFGSGISETFTILSKDDLKVDLDKASLAPRTAIAITWKPINTLGLANISIIRLSTKKVTEIAVNIDDNGPFELAGDYAPGAYQVIVNSSIGSGVSEIFQVTTTSLEVTAAPNNISSADPKTTVSWTPHDEYQKEVILYIKKGETEVDKMAVENSGSYSLDLTTMGLSPGLYSVGINSDIGDGFSKLYIYSNAGLDVSSPNAASSIFNNTEAMRVEWESFDESVSDVQITLVNNNTGEKVVKIAENTGSYDVNIAELNLEVGTYHAIVSSDFGAGISSPFILRYAEHLKINSPNATTNISQAGSILFNWLPTNLAGGNVSIKIYQPSNKDIVYGPFSTADDGNAELNLADKVINKNLALDNNLPFVGIDTAAAPGAVK
ncbi:hypothetical protein MDAP_001363 [Mitosporidium daphniae]